MKSTNRFLSVLLAVAGSTFVFSQRHTDHGALRSIAAEARVEAQTKKEEALNFARLMNLPVRQVLANGKVVEIMEIRQGRPFYVETANANAAITTRANRVYPGGVAGLNLTGSGVLLGKWDGGTARVTHQELAGRVTVMDGEARSGDHATHVAGTMIASGVSATARGMSYQGALHSYGWNNDTSEMATAGSNGLRLSNHSYGYITGWYFNGASWYWFGDLSLSTVEDNGFGLYDDNARAWDQVAYNAPYLLICKSAGNDRNEGPAAGATHFHWNNATSSWVSATDVHAKDGAGTGYDTISYNGTAKNIMTVGAVGDVLSYTGPSSVAMTSFSGWGPTDDGRIKPDIVGNGVSLTSSVGSSDTGYGSFSGTSMSSPNVAGSLGLLVQHYRNLNLGVDMLAATLKALAIHTADEAGAAPGPDYSFGWGLLNIERAARVITDDFAAPATIREDVISTGQTRTLNVYSDGANPLRVTIAWTDPAGTPPGWLLDPPTRLLVNDLDVRITGPNGTTMPWILDPANPSAAATRGDNIRDNVEQVLIDAPIAGTYSITVTHKGVGLSPSGSQAYSMVVSGAAAPPTTPVLTDLTLSASSVAGGGSVTGTVTLSSTAGGTVNLSSSASYATTPASVTVAPGATSASFTINTTAVAISSTATISATMDGVTKTQNLQVRAASLVSVSMSPSTVTGGASSTGTVTVSGAIPSGGIIVGLTDNSSNVGTPPMVTVAQGQTTATFTVTTSAVSTTETATITASFDGTTRTAGLTVQSPAPSLTGLSLSASSVAGGGSVTGTVTLSNTAGGTVSLASSEAFATTPATVTVPAGSTTANFTVSTVAVASTGVATISASFNGSSSTQDLQVRAASLVSVSVSPSSVVGGNSSTGTVTVSGAIPSGGIVVTLSDNSGNVSTPGSVTIGQGQTSATFTVTTSSVSANETATISASFDGTTRTASLTVEPAPVAASLSGFSITPSTVKAGMSATGTLTLTSPAPAGGAAVSISSSDPSVASAPSIVTVPAGTSSVTFTISTFRGKNRTVVTFTASRNGVVRTANLAVAK